MVPGASTGPWKSAPGHHRPQPQKAALAVRGQQGADHAPVVTPTATCTGRPLACTAAAKSGWK